LDLQQLHERLLHYAKVNPKIRDEDAYGDNRHTYCHLLFLGKQDGKVHRFEVRGFTYKSEYPVLDISVVNWTMIAGTGGLVLKNDPEQLKNWIIEEDSPNAKVLYGYN